MIAESLKLGEDARREIVRIEVEKVEDISPESIKELKARAEKLLLNIKEYENFLNDGGAGDKDRCEFARKRVHLVALDIGRII